MEWNGVKRYSIRSQPTATARCFLPERWPGWLGSTYAVPGPVFGAFDMPHEVENVGLVSHRYSILTICHPHGGQTYLKIQLRATVEDTLTSVLTAEPTTAPSPRSSSHPEMYMIMMPPGGPSLDAIAALLDIIRQRGGGYDAISSRKCLWLADLVLFDSSAMKFREAWLAEGRIFPDWPIRTPN